VSSPRHSPLVLDSWAVLAYLQGEAPAQKVADLLTKTLDKSIPALMSVVNLGEVWYILAREISEQEANEAIQNVRSWGIEVMDVNWPLTQTAARYKSAHKMSYADTFAAALALQQKATLVTGDFEFKALEKEIEILWLR